MPSILAIDTSCDICSVALSLDGETRELCSSSARQHASELLPMVQRLLAEAELKPAQLDAIALVRGPGSFTGLRIGAAVAQGLAWPHERPVLTISSLAVVALGASQQHGCSRVLSALQAREGELYWAAYQRVDAGVQLQGQEEVLSVTAAAQKADALNEEWAGAGNAWEEGGALHAAITVARIRFPDIQPRASLLSVLAREQFLRGDTLAAEAALPVYLKEQEYR